MKKSLVLALVLSASVISTNALAMESTASSAQSIVASIALTISLPVATTAAPTMTTGASTDASSGNYKIIIAAQEDAANLLASNGAIRGVALQKALELIRATNPSLEASDMQIAEGILKLQARQ